MMVWRLVDLSDDTGHAWFLGSSKWHHLQSDLVGLCDPEWLQFMLHKWEFKIPIYNILQVLSKEHRWSKMATHSKALITGRAYLSISKTGELHGSESGDKVHIRKALWHKTQERRSRDSLSQRGHQRFPLSDHLMMNIATHPPDSSLLTQSCRGCSAFVWRALLQGHGHERKKNQTDHLINLFCL